MNMEVHIRVDVKERKKMENMKLNDRVSQDKSYQSRNGTHTELIGHCP